MKRLYNYTIPMHRLDKGFKACYRYSKYDSCIYDNSYYNYVIIDTIADNVLPLFSKILEFYTLNNFSELEKFHKYEINLYHYLSKRLIGPCSTILMESTIIMMFHPLMKEEMVNLLTHLKETEVNSDETSFYFNNVLNNFTLIGPRIGENIFKILKSLTADSERNVINKFKNETEFSDYIHQLTDDDVMLLETFSPKSSFKMNEFIFRELTKEKLLQSTNSNTELDISLLSSNKEINENLKKLFLRNSYPIEKTTAHTSKININSNFIEIPTERTVFMHRKNAKLDVLNKKLENSIRENKKKDKSKDKTIKLQSKKTVNKSQIEEPQSKLMNIYEKTYMMLIKRNIEIVENNKNITTPVYNLIFSKGHSLDLLRRFVYLESRPIGLKEYKYYLTNSKSFIFPDDYPSTHSYQTYIKEKTIKTIDRYCRYPASKRVNFQKIGNPYPFYPPWHRLKNKTQQPLLPSFPQFNKDVEVVTDLSNKLMLIRQFKLQNIVEPSTKIFLLPVFIEMVTKGTPRFNSLICFPSKEDLIKLKLNIQAKSEGKNVVNKFFNNLQKTNEFVLPSDSVDEKIEEVLHVTEVRNKYFRMEYKTIKEEILTRKDEDNQILYSSEILNHDLTVKMPGNKDISRDVIGFVTSGQFSYLNSKGVAKGFITVESYESLINMSREYFEKCESHKRVARDNGYVIALVRKNTSRNYYYAKIHLMKIN